MLRGGSTLVAPAALPVGAAPRRANPLATPNRGLAHRRRRRGQRRSKQPHDDLGDGTSATSIDPASMDGEERGTAPNRAATREPRHPTEAATGEMRACGTSGGALLFCSQPLVCLHLGCFSDGIGPKHGRHGHEIRYVMYAPPLPYLRSSHSRRRPTFLLPLPLPSQTLDLHSPPTLFPKIKRLG